jgi:hypothetical protein
MDIFAHPCNIPLSSQQAAANLPAEIKPYFCLEASSKPGFTFLHDLQTDETDFEMASRKQNLLNPLKAINTHGLARGTNSLMKNPLF